MMDDVLAVDIVPLVVVVIFVVVTALRLSPVAQLYHVPCDDLVPLWLNSA